MHLKSLCAAAALTFGICSFGYAAPPVMPNADLSIAEELKPIPVQRRCHGREYKHYHNQLGRSAWHYHGRGCYPVQVRRRPPVREYYPSRPYRDNCVTLGTPGYAFQFCD